MIIKYVDVAPDYLLADAINEINSIDWKAIDDGRTKRTPAFASSTSIQIRIHKQPEQMHSNVHEWGKIVETTDHPVHIKKFPKVILLADWIKNRVGGVKLGRVMLVNLSSGGVVIPHIDKGEYFDVHSRFHIPIKTNSKVNFGSSLNENLSHMQEHCLYQLNNTALHYVENLGDEDRIHLIVDVELPSRNTPENFTVSF